MRISWVMIGAFVAVVQMASFSAQARKGYAKPTFEMSIPDNLGRAPNSADVRIVKGFDGRRPEEAVALARRNFVGSMHARNERFVGSMLTSSHKAFTLAINNALTAGSPVQTKMKAAFAGADQIAVLGTPSAIHPVGFLARISGKSKYFVRNESGDFQEVAKFRYPVFVKTRLDLADGTIRTNYLKWKAPQLAEETAKVIEGR